MRSLLALMMSPHVFYVCYAFVPSLSSRKFNRVLPLRSSICLSGGFEFWRFFSGSVGQGNELQMMEEENPFLSRQNEAIERLMERALLLYSKSTGLWIRGQLESILDYLSGTVRVRPRQQKAIDEALVQRAFTRLETLVGDFQKSQVSDEYSRRIEQELKLVEHQLTIFESYLLLTVNVSIAPQRPQQPLMATSLFSEDQASTSVFPLDSMYEEDGTTNGQDENVMEEADVVVVGAGLGGLCAGAVLNTVYNKKVAIYESHYLAGGCAHSFDRSWQGNNKNLTFTFDSGPTILLGCSSPPYNALQQVLEAVNQTIEWIPYDGWGMIENPTRPNEMRWRCELGPKAFEQGPLRKFGGELAAQEFKALQLATEDLTAGASIPAMVMRAGPMALVPLLRHCGTLLQLIQQGATLTGTFAPFMDGPVFTVTSPWLRNWLDALAFSLSGLPASRTAAAAMAFVLNDMHREGAALDYPKGGMGEIVSALVRGVEQGGNGSRVYLRQHVESIDSNDDATRITGITLTKGGKKVWARDGVICNAPMWSLRSLIKDDRVKRKLNNEKPILDVRRPPTAWTVTAEGSSIKFKHRLRNQESTSQSLLSQCDSAEMTASFLHLHLAIDATGLNLDAFEAHYTVMDRSLAGDGSFVNGVKDGPCAVGNMIAVSNPCVIDRTLAPEGYILIHAYGAGNEPYELWESMDRNSVDYKELKGKRAEFLWRAVESIVPDVRERAVLQMIGSPLTHERFLRRPRGTYGSATEDYLKDGSTPFPTLVLASDGVFPGIGVPSVAIAGASAANALVGVFEQWRKLDVLHADGRLKVS
jgi:phytoene dehydrogenase-like protein